MAIAEIRGMGSTMPAKHHIMRGGGRIYVRRINSNGGDIAPTITCTISKGVQRQLDNGGGYVLDYFVVHHDRADEGGIDGL